ncbi:hypothetical protein, partial [Shigella sp. FC2383]|uniref:hypothetical protein n=1 Tax=Shigella sp. FC2383 TaxID=1890305 RepID=UPI0011BF0AF7
MKPDLITSVERSRHDGPAAAAIANPFLPELVIRDITARDRAVHAFNKRWRSVVKPDLITSVERSRHDGPAAAAIAN